MLRKIIFIMTIFLSFNASADELSEYDNFIWAVRSYDLPTIKTMLSNGYDINTSDNSGWTALHWSNFGHSMEAEKFFKTLSLLIKNGANPNLVDFRGRNALVLMLSPGIDQIAPPPVEAAEILLNAGTDITQEDEDGDSACKLGINSEYENIKILFETYRRVCTGS